MKILDTIRNYIADNDISNAVQYLQSLDVKNEQLKNDISLVIGRYNNWADNEARSTKIDNDVERNKILFSLLYYAGKCETSKEKQRINNANKLYRILSFILAVGVLSLLSYSIFMNSKISQLENKNNEMVGEFDNLQKENKKNVGKLAFYRSWEKYGFFLDGDDKWFEVNIRHKTLEDVFGDNKRYLFVAYVYDEENEKVRFSERNRIFISKTYPIGKPVNNDPKKIRVDIDKNSHPQVELRDEVYISFFIVPEHFNPKLCENDNINCLKSNGAILLGTKMATSENVD